jgi:hypothetical protein
MLPDLNSRAPGHEAGVACPRSYSWLLEGQIAFTFMILFLKLDCSNEWRSDAIVTYAEMALSNAELGPLVDTFEYSSEFWCS